MGGPEVLNYVWVLHCAKKVALLLKLSPWGPSLRPRLDKNGVQEFGRTWE